MRLNVVSGEYALGVLAPKLPGTTVAFNEAMMMGQVCETPFSPAFCALRARELAVSQSGYQDKLRPYREAAAALTAGDEAYLYFGADTFCQLNLLTLLAHLEALGFAGSAYYIQTDDVSCQAQAAAEQATVRGAGALYRQVFVERTVPEGGSAPLRHAAARYLQLLAPDGEYARLIRQNARLSEKELAILLLKAGREDGLGDVQAFEMIRTFR